MAEHPSRYPLRRGRRRGRRWPRRLRRWGAARWVAVAILFGAVAVAAMAMRHRQDDPRAALARAEAAWAAADYSGTRDAALVATAGRAERGRALILLARADIDLGDGLAADAAVTRAAAAGVPAARLHALRAAALLLEGDAVSALAEVARAPPTDGVAAMRVRARAMAAAGDAAGAQAVLAGTGDAGALDDLGRIRFDTGDVAGATAAVTRAAALRPHEPATLVLQGQLVRSRYGLTASLPWFAAALRVDPGYPPALIEQAATLGEAGRYREALAAARRALTVRPGNPQALYLLAVIAARGGDMDLAAAMLDRIGHALDALPGMLLMQGAVAQAHGQPELAVSVWGDLLDRQPDNRAVRRLLAGALLRSGDPGGALDAIRPLATRPDADAATLELAARAFRLLGDGTAAVAWHDRAMADARGVAGPIVPDVGIASLTADAAAAPNDPGRALALIRGLIAAGDTAGAVARAQALATGLPGIPAAQLVLGDALAAANRFAEAAAVYARAADLAFDEPTMLRFVDALGRAGRGADAARVLALFLGQNPQDVAALRIAGRWQVTAGQDAAAVATLERARRLAGNRDAGLLADLARACAGVGQAARALAYARAAYALAPMNAGVVDAYAAVLAAAGNTDGAAQMRAKLRALP